MGLKKSFNVFAYLCYATTIRVSIGQKLGITMLSVNGLIIMFLFGIGIGIAIEGFSNLRKLRALEKQNGMTIEDLQDSYNFAIGLLYENDVEILQNYVFMTTQEEKLAYRKEIGNE